jgi:hypothetical protein
MTGRSSREFGTHVVAKRTAQPQVSQPKGRVAITRGADDGVLKTPELLALVAEGLSGLGWDETHPPFDAERLQVVLDLDGPTGWVVAAWRDVYADRDQRLEVEMCVEGFTDQHLCWNCGDLGCAERDDLLWCAACLKEEKK